MAQSTLQIPETLDNGTVITLRRYNHTKLHHWEMLLLIAQPDFSPELEGEEGGGGEGIWTQGGGLLLIWYRHGRIPIVQYPHYMARKLHRSIFGWHHKLDGILFCIASTLRRILVVPTFHSTHALRHDV